MENTGDDAKILAIVTLGLGSILFGFIPNLIPGDGRRSPLLISLLLCFGAGVLLATSIVHMLPEVRESLNQYTEIVVCGGFFFMYFVDELVHIYFHKKVCNTNNVPQHRNYLAIRSRARENSNPSNVVQTEQQGLLQPTNRQCDANRDFLRNPQNTPPENPPEPDIFSEIPTGVFGLICALSLHSFIEGLAIGVQNSKAKTVLLLIAVSAHKHVMSFCLGLEFYSNPLLKLKSQVTAILVFALGSVVGIITGMIIVDLPSGWTQSAVPVLQGVASGTLLYVTVCEIIPRERTRWKHVPLRRLAGLNQLFCIILGFVIITVLNFYLKDT